MEAWKPERLSELADLWNEVRPEEPLIEDELEACWSDDAVVLGADDGVVVAHSTNGNAWIDLLAVRPGARRNRLGSALVEAAIDATGADRIQFGASVPWYLWSGIDTSWTSALALAEHLDFDFPGVAMLNMSVDPRWQVGWLRPPDMRTERVDGVDSQAVLDAVEREHPNWVDEVSRGVDQATVHAVWSDSRQLLGMAAHSVNRLGWIGPMATFEGSRGRGVGSTALAAVCVDLAAAGYPSVEISWVDPIRFYAKAAGAQVGRVFLPLSKTIRPPASRP